MTNNAVQMVSNVLDYEEGYHSKRHPSHYNDEYYQARARIAVDKFFKGVPRDARILDYGCGLGQNIVHFPNAIGFDISQYGLDFCRIKGLNVTNDLDTLEDESFDYVFSSHVLEHHPHPKTMIEEMRAKLKPGCNLILAIPYERHGKASFELDLNQHLYMWNFRTINNLLLTCGFQILENKYLRGAGYEKLLLLNRWSYEFYRKMTILVSYIFGIKEIMVVAKKIG